MNADQAANTVVKLLEEIRDRLPAPEPVSDDRGEPGSDGEYFPAMVTGIASPNGNPHELWLNRNGVVLYRPIGSEPVVDGFRLYVRDGK